MDPTQISSAIAAAVVIATIASNVITALINNHHQMNLRKQELKEDLLRNSAYHKRDILENYLKYSGQLFSSGTIGDFQEYGSCYLQALLYVDEETGAMMEQAHMLLITQNRDASLHSLMCDIAHNIKRIVKTLMPE